MNTVTRVWRCYAAVLPVSWPGVTCEAAGDKDSGAEKHTKETGHPTTSGTEQGTRWAVK